MKFLTALLIGTISFFNVANAHSVKEVSFDSKGKSLKGDLYLPSDFKEGQKRPGVIITGAWTTVKEQMPKTYALKMVDKGYVVLTFDFRGWGESEGENRYLESPTRKSEDIVSAIQFFSNRPEVDSERVHGLGICASAGYMADAYVKSQELKSVALVAPWLHNRELVNQVYGGEQTVNNLIQVSRDAASKFQTTGELSYIQGASTTDESSLMYRMPYYTETDRGLIPEWDNKFNLASWEGWLTYDAVKVAEGLNKEILLVHSENAMIPAGAKEFVRRSNGNAKMIMLDGVSQFDFYDNDTHVSAASQHVEEFFKN